MNERIFKLQSLLLSELRQVVVEKFDASKFGFVSINSVELNPKMSVGKVFVYSATNKSGLVKALNADMRLFVPILKKRLNMRNIPRFKFTFEESNEKLNRIDELLSKIHDKNENN